MVPLERALLLVGRDEEQQLLHCEALGGQAAAPSSTWRSCNTRPLAQHQRPPLRLLPPSASHHRPQLRCLRAGWLGLQQRQPGIQVRGGPRLRLSRGAERVRHLRRPGAMPEVRGRRAGRLLRADACASVVAEVAGRLGARRLPGRRRLRRRAAWPELRGRLLQRLRGDLYYYNNNNNNNDNNNNNNNDDNNRKLIDSHNNHVYRHYHYLYYYHQ